MQIRPFLSPRCLAVSALAIAYLAVAPVQFRMDGMRELADELTRRNRAPTP